jgi:hypothetical protein
MTVANFSEKELWAYLNSNGCAPNSEDLDKKLVVYKNLQNRRTAIIQMRNCYYPRYIRFVCDDLRIPVPDFVERYESSLQELRSRQETGPSGEKSSDKESDTDQST